LDRTIQLLILAFEFFPGVVIDDDVGIDAATFNDPLFAVLRIRSEFRLEELAAIGERQRLSYANNATPRAFPDQLAEPQALKAIGKNIAIGCGKFVG
jgi:hypothetical protein